MSDRRPEDDGFRAPLRPARTTARRDWSSRRRARVAGQSAAAALRQPERRLRRRSFSRRGTDWDDRLTPAQRRKWRERENFDSAESNGSDLSETQSKRNRLNYSFARFLNISSLLHCPRLDCTRKMRSRCEFIARERAHGCVSGSRGFFFFAKVPAKNVISPGKFINEMI